MNMIRLFSNAARTVASTELAQLRKRTGFTLVNCRKALQLCDNDLAKAEKWLQAEAKKLGWEKAMKLQSRTANEGLIAVAKANNKIVMVEVNCETDFVARNEKFVSLAQVVANACLTHDTSQSDTNMKKGISQEELENLKIPGGEKLCDFVALRIGEFGENIVLRRGLSYEADKGINVDVAVHPPTKDCSTVLTGRYGVFVAYEKIEGETAACDRNPGKLIENLCSHIIGANPQRIGNKDVEGHEDQDDEVALLKQEYMMNPEITVGELLESEGIKVVDFQRLQCGEDDVDQKTENELGDCEKRAEIV